MHTSADEHTPISSKAINSLTALRSRSVPTRRRLAGVLAFACLWAVSTGVQAQSPDRGFRWGGAAGLRGGLPLGGDVSTEGANQDEFVPGVSFQLELFSVQLGDTLQLSPVIEVGLEGGLSEEQYRDALLGEDGNVDDVSASRASAGLLVRWMPLASGGRLRPYLLGGLSYLRSGVTYTEPTMFGGPPDAGGPPEMAAGDGGEAAGAPEGDSDGMMADDDGGAAPGGGFPFGAPASVFRHTGLGIEAGLGVRLELPAPWFGEDGIMPVSLELIYRQGVWLELEQSGSAVDLDLLAPEGMSMNTLALSVTVGYLR